MLQPYALLCTRYFSIIMIASEMILSFTVPLLVQKVWCGREKNADMMM